MIRVLYLTMNANCLSTTVPTMNWMSQLPARGLEPVLVCTTDGDFPRWAAKRGIPTYIVPLPHPQKLRAASFLASMRRLIAIAKKHNTQLVHCNEQNIYPIGQYLARWRRIPVVVSVHFQMDRGFCEWAFRGRRAPRRMYFVSRSLVDQCREALRGVVDDSRFLVLPNALDMSLYGRDDSLRVTFRREHGLDGFHAIGDACALRPRKQLEHLFAAAAALGRTDVRVVVAGEALPGEEEYAKGMLEDGRKTLGDRLVYLGHRHGLRDYFNGLDLFVNTSQLESFGISALEAMACGCPVVGYPSSSVSEVVLPGGGEMVEQDNVAALVAVLKKWLDDPARLRDARADAFKRAQVFDSRLFLDQLWNDYQFLVGSPSR